MATRRIAVFGGSFNPPCLHHREIVERLAERFDEVIVVPCGPRPDKPGVDDIAPVHRAAMATVAFGGIPNVEVDLFDLEHNRFTRHADLEARYGARGELWFVVGADLACGGGAGAAAIQRTWHRGEEIWRTRRFVVSMRQGYPVTNGDLPPHSEVIAPMLHGSSTEARLAAFGRKPLDRMTSPRIAAYIERYGLYRGTAPRTTILAFDRPRAYAVAYGDEAKIAALIAASGFEIVDDVADADCILAVGGDGTMLRAVRRHWERRLPFIGVNAGTLGYLMNGDAAPLAERPLMLRCHLLSMLHVEAETPDGSVLRRTAFNDAWVERMTGQTAWLSLTVDGRERIPRLHGDGLLLSTPQGSTAYARAMGAVPLLADADAWMVVGNNVASPLGWRSAPLSRASEIVIETRCRGKRPVRGVVDSEDLGEVVSLRARMSRVAAAELCFHPSHDLASKLAAGLFPA